MHSFLSNHFKSGLLTSLLLAGAPFAHAIDYYWNLPGGGVFNEADNWNPDPIGTGTHRYFNNNASGTIEFTENASMTGLYFNSPAGEPGDGTLILNLTDRILNTTSWLDFSGTNNHITLQGGSGSFERLRMLGSTNTLILNQTQLSGSSQYLRLQGSEGHNTLRLENGASISFTAGLDTTIGDGLGGHNQIIITGAGSSLNFVGATGDDNRRFRIGVSGSQNNLLRVEQGGNFISNTDQATILGHGANSSNNRLEIDGAGSTASIRQLLIGNNATAINNVVRVSDGGQLTITNNQRIGIGVTSGSTGNRLEIDGGSVTAHTIRLSEALQTSNTLQVINNGTLQVSTLLRAYHGTLEVDQGTITTNQLQVDANATVDFRSGLIAAQAATVSNTSGFEVGNGGTETAIYRLTNASNTHNFSQGLSLNSNARLEGTGTLSAAVSASAGAIVSVGYEVGSNKTFGILTIDQSGSGSWDNDGVTLIMGIGDLSTGSLEAGTHYDLLSFGSGYTFEAGGAILVDLTYYQALSSGSEEFRILAWENFSGDWENIAVSFSGVTSDLSYQFQADGLYITAVPEPETLALLLSLPLLATVVYLRRNRHIIS